MCLGQQIAIMCHKQALQLSGARQQICVGFFSAIIFGSGDNLDLRFPSAHGLPRDGAVRKAR